MTAPDQKKYDLELVDAMRRLAQQIEPRSGKAALILRMGADRLSARVNGAPERKS